MNNNVNLSLNNINSNLYNYLSVSGLLYSLINTTNTYTNINKNNITYLYNSINTISSNIYTNNTYLYNSINTISGNIYNNNTYLYNSINISNFILSDNTKNT